MQRRRHGWAAALCLAAVGLTAVRGTEPSGHILASIARVNVASPAAAPRLRLTLEGVSPLGGAMLRVRAPEGVTLSAVPLPGSDETSLPPRATDDAFVLGEIGRGRVVVLDFAVTLSRGAGGIAVFTVTGTLPDGRVVQEPIAWTVGSPAARPFHRFGAAEYPAGLLPKNGS